MRMRARTARLALEDGTLFHGEAFGASVDALGEVVFNTAMSGYEEVVTDPSYRCQLVVMTAPQMGNVGWNREDLESRGPMCAGLILRELSPLPSSWRSQGTLDEALAQAGVPGIAGVDTRALTRMLRDEGAKSALLTHAPPGEVPDEELCRRARAFGSMEGRDLVHEVTCERPYVWHEGSLVPGGRARHAERVGHVLVYDFGVKRNILRQLVDVGFTVTVVPADTPAREALALAPDAFLLSNGPGDPAALPRIIDNVRDLIETGRPLLGICLGHQLLGRALGGTTYKLLFGHHGSNHPVKDLGTGRVEITSQNHGFALSAESLGGLALVTHLNLNDNTVEGLRVPGRPVFGIQYHPEASPGPHDSRYLFKRFARLLTHGARSLEDQGG